MIGFAPAKINIGLAITGKRNDGYHDIESLMVQIPFFDIIEMHPAKEFSFYSSGIPIPHTPSNLCEQAYALMKENFAIEPISIHLRKQIPIGAGLGGGSSDASFVLKAINELYNLKLDTEKLRALSSNLGSDCPLFIEPNAQFATGRGEQLKPFKVRFENHYLYLLNPKIHISTAKAYSLIQTYSKPNVLEKNLLRPIEDWRHHIQNDFEEAFETSFPEILELKEKLYNSGAIYASMSGSGSSVFGVFNESKLPNITDFQEHIVYQGKFDTDYL